MSASEANLQLLIQEGESLLRKLAAASPDRDRNRALWLRQYLYAEKIASGHPAFDLLHREDSPLFPDEVLADDVAQLALRLDVPGDLPEAPLQELLDWCQRYAFQIHPFIIAAEWYAGLLDLSGSEQLARMMANLHLLKNRFPAAVAPPGAWRSAAAEAREKGLKNLAVFFANHSIKQLEDFLLQVGANQQKSWEQTLAMLEKNLQRNQPPEKRTPENLLLRLDDSIFPLIELLAQKTGRFDRLYRVTEKQITAYLDGKPHPCPAAEAQDFLSARIREQPEQLSEIDLLFRWSGFRYDQSFGKELSLNFTLRFGPEAYEVYGPDFQRVCEKHYGLPVLPDELGNMADQAGEFLTAKLGAEGPDALYL